MPINQTPNPIDEIKTLLDSDNENGLYYDLVRSYLDSDSTYMKSLDRDALIAQRDETDALYPNTATNATRADLDRVLDALIAAADAPFFRDELSHLAINLSLCPMHFQDWAACFDDELDDCAQIRMIFPYSHDT